MRLTHTLRYDTIRVLVSLGSSRVVRSLSPGLSLKFPCNSVGNFYAKIIDRAAKCTRYHESFYNTQTKYIYLPRVILISSDFQSRPNGFLTLY